MFFHRQYCRIFFYEHGLIIFRLLWFNYSSSWNNLVALCVTAMISRYVQAAALPAMTVTLLLFIQHPEQTMKKMRLESSSKASRGRSMVQNCWTCVCSINREGRDNKGRNSKGMESKKRNSQESDSRKGKPKRDNSKRGHNDGSCAYIKQLVYVKFGGIRRLLDERLCG